MTSLRSQPLALLVLVLVAQPLAFCWMLSPSSPQLLSSSAPRFLAPQRSAFSARIQGFKVRRLRGSRGAEGLMGLRAKDSENGDPDGEEKGGALSKLDAESEAQLEDLMQGINQIQDGLKLIQSGLSFRAQKQVDDISTIGQQAINTVEQSIGQEAMTERLEAARAAVMQNIGIGEEDVPPVDGPPFDLNTAVFLAGSAFDCYNDPEGGVIKLYEDGVKVSYTSSRALALAHSGVLMMRVKGAKLQAGKGLLGSEGQKCDAYVKLKVNGAVTKTEIAKNTLNPEWDETKVMYVGPIDTDSVEIQLYDADILLGKDEMINWTPDPLIGRAEIPVSSLVDGLGWQTLEVELEQPEEPMTAADVENQNNPYWAKIPREVLVQSWPSLLAGTATGGTLELEVQFLPLNRSPKDYDSNAEGPEGDTSTVQKVDELAEGEWNLLAKYKNDYEVDEQIFRKENLERLCFFDEDETDTQVSVWQDRRDNRLVMAFRGTEQVKWKDLLTDALIVQQKFDLGCDLDEEIDLPPLFTTGAILGAKKTDPKASKEEELEFQNQFVDAGSLGSLMEELTSTDGFSKMLSSIANSENVNAVSEAGRTAFKGFTGKDLENYEFGDLTKSLISKVTSSDYKFGDVTKGALSWFNSDSEDEKALPAAEEDSEDSKLHLGFLRGYLSVRPRIVNFMKAVLEDDDPNDPLEIYITGHSLGGALATICAADIQALFPNNKVIMYNYGSPRVGNMAFVKRFNELVPQAFRIVNDADVVARVPRSNLQNYHHVARTVLVSAKEDRNVWVEGESDGIDPLRERWTELSELVNAELTLLQDLVKGESLGDHMEDAYFVALKQAQKSQIG